MKMSKVMIVGNSIDGFFSFRKELAAELKERGYDVILVFPDGSRTEYFAEQGFQMIRVEMERHGVNPLQELALLNAFRRVIKREKPDVVLTYTIKPNIYAGLACRMLGVPYIANITGLGTAVECGGWLQKITLPLYRMGLRKAGMVFFQNAENQRFMLEKRAVNGEHALLPGSGVNLEQYQLSDYPDEGTVDFVFVGRLMKQKGIDQYLEAAQAIRSEYPQTRFHVCGAMEESYEERIAELEKRNVIIYHGVVRDMNGMYKKMSCTVHPTYYPEGLSNVLLESCASGRAIITTDRAGCREVVDDGVNGYVVKQQDSQDLIRKIKQFLALTPEEQRQMGLNGRAKVEKEFDRRIVIDQYLRAIERIQRT